MADFADCTRMVLLDTPAPDGVALSRGSIDTGAVVAALKKAEAQGVSLRIRACDDPAEPSGQQPSSNRDAGQPDSLAPLIDACQRAGLRVRLEYAPAFDSRPAAEHPDWMHRSVDGRIGSMPCLNGPAVEQIIEPQVGRLAARYEVDEWVFAIGAGELRGPCYCVSCRESYRRAYGLDVPKDSDDPSWGSYAAWLRQIGCTFERRMAEAVRKHRPNAVVGFRGSYTIRMPEPPRDSSSFLTTDQTDGVAGIDFEGRYLSSLGVPFEGVIHASTHRHNPWAIKSVAAARPEAATLVAHGGRCVVVAPPCPCGRLDGRSGRHLRKLLRFIARREGLHEGAKPAHDLAILHSASTFYNTGTQLFGNPAALDKVRGAHAMLSAGGRHFAIVNERTLRDHIDEYSGVILPGQEVLAPETIAALHRYVRRGGVLIASHPFPPELDGLLGVRRAGGDDSARALIESPGGRLRRGLHGMPIAVGGQPFGVFQAIGAKVLAGRIEIPVSDDGAAPGKPCKGKRSQNTAISVCKFGSGRAVMIAAEIFSAYAREGYPEHGTLVRNLIRRYVDPQCGIRAPAGVQVIRWRRRRTALIHLVNGAGPDEPGEGPRPMTRVRVRVRRKRRPRSVVLLPKKQKLKFTWKRGVLRFTVPRLKTHTCAMIRG